MSLKSEKPLMKRSTRTAVMVVVVAALTLEATSLIQTFYAQRGLREEAAKRAESQLELTRNEILDIIDQTETAVRNNVWIARWCLDHQDSAGVVCRRMVADNPVVVGSTVALVPGYSSRYPLYAPYVYRNDEGLQFQSLVDPSYNYPSHEWFVKPIELDAPYWSEPYVDEGGGEVLMTTYSMPVKDSKGRIGAVLTADIALDWLTDLLADIRVYPHSTSLMLSRTGHFMLSKNRELVDQESVTEVMAQVGDTPFFVELERSMTSGESGNVVYKFKGKVYHIFYAPVDKTGWSMCVIIPDTDIFGSVRRVTFMVTLLQLLGILMLALILRSFLRGQHQFNELEQKRQLMQNELHIAQSIQMSMVPKVFPPFPERHDLDLAASIIPAKEVGGDLYDFFIRDEKLFFCIGDVSGKGVPASLVMAVTRATFRTVAAYEDRPGAIVGSMNKRLAEMNDTEMFVTFFCGVMDLEKGRLSYCNAGHNPPLILTDAIRTLPTKPNLPLGILPDMFFEEQDCDFLYDDALFLYTDGLTEAENEAHEQFGEERMEQALHGRKDSQAHLATVRAQVEAFVGDALQSDDLTMLFIHYLGNDKVVAPDLTLVMHNDIQQLAQLPDWMDQVGDAYHLDPALVMSLNLALEEAATNVILYAYPKGSCGSVELSADLVEGKRLRFVLTDSGKPFDPTAAPDPDIAASAVDRPIGGLGIFLVRQIMDEVHYNYDGEHNILTMIKNI